MSRDVRRAEEQVSILLLGRWTRPFSATFFLIPRLCLIGAVISCPLHKRDDDGLASATHVKYRQSCGRFCTRIACQGISQAVIHLFAHTILHAVQDLLWLSGCDCMWMQLVAGCSQEGGTTLRRVPWDNMSDGMSPEVVSLPSYRDRLVVKFRPTRSQLSSSFGVLHFQKA